MRAGAALRGAHLRLPGHGQDGPTLEIYQYRSAAERQTSAANGPGFAHIAFAVDDIAAARASILAAGGRRVTWCYMRDPEGNMVELQSWAPGKSGQ